MTCIFNSFYWCPILSFLSPELLAKHNHFLPILTFVQKSNSRKMVTLVYIFTVQQFENQRIIFLNIKNRMHLHKFFNPIMPLVRVTIRFCHKSILQRSWLAQSICHEMPFQKWLDLNYMLLPISCIKNQVPCLLNAVSIGFVRRYVVGYLFGSKKYRDTFCTALILMISGL